MIQALNIEQSNHQASKEYNKQLTKLYDKHLTPVNTKQTLSLFNEKLSFSNLKILYKIAVLQNANRDEMIKLLKQQNKELREEIKALKNEHRKGFKPKIVHLNKI